MFASLVALFGVGVVLVAMIEVQAGVLVVAVAALFKASCFIDRPSDADT